MIEKNEQEQKIENNEEIVIKNNNMLINWLIKLSKISSAISFLIDFNNIERPNELLFESKEFNDIEELITQSLIRINNNSIKIQKNIIDKKEANQGGHICQNDQCDHGVQGGVK